MYQTVVFDNPREQWAGLFANILAADYLQRQRERYLNSLLNGMDFNSLFQGQTNPYGRGLGLPRIGQNIANWGGLLSNTARKSSLSPITANIGLPTIDSSSSFLNSGLLGSLFGGII